MNEKQTRAASFSMLAKNLYFLLSMFLIQDRLRLVLSYYWAYRSSKYLKDFQWIWDLQNLKEHIHLFDGRSPGLYCTVWDWFAEEFSTRHICFYGLFNPLGRCHVVAGGAFVGND